jgi:integrase
MTPSTSPATAALTARLRTLIPDYLRVRRALGYKLVHAERVLFAFVDHLEAAGAQAVTVDHAVAFATAKPDNSPRSQALRLSAVRCFARWAQLHDPTVQVPPARLLPARPTRLAPYFYSDADIAALLEAAGQLRTPATAAAMHTLIALMAATGVRTGEALALEVADLDVTASTLTVTGKYGKTRLLPLHATVTAGLVAYLRLRRQLVSVDVCPALLVGPSLAWLSPTYADYVFRQLTYRVGLASASSICRPRLHDLRHRFAVTTLLDAYRRGQDPAAVLALLGTWLGHAHPASTYWYLTATTELLAAAADRVATHTPDSGEDAS